MIYCNQFQFISVESPTEVSVMSENMDPWFFHQHRFSTRFSTAGLCMRGSNAYCMFPATQIQLVAPRSKVAVFKVSVSMILKVAVLYLPLQVFQFPAPEITVPMVPKSKVVAQKILVHKVWGQIVPVPKTAVLKFTAPKSPISIPTPKSPIPMFTALKASGPRNQYKKF